MRVLILGGTAFIGAAAARRLHALGHEVMVFHRGKTRSPLPPEIRHVLGDRHDWNRHAGELAALKPDVLLDMLAMTAQDARDAVATFAGVARRAVVISSCDVYRAFGVLNGSESGAPDPLPLTEKSPLRDRLYPYRGSKPRPEDHPQRWMDHYDKILVERAYHEDRRLPATVLRLPMVYGERDRQHRMFPYLKRMADGRPGILLQDSVAPWRGCRGYVENVAEAIALCVVHPAAAGKTYHVADRDSPAERDWVKAIGRAMGWVGRVYELPEEELPMDLQAGMNPAQELVLDSSRIRKELGYSESVPFEEAVRRTAAWERDNYPVAFDAARFNYQEENDVLARIIKRERDNNA
ncbi:MAG: NAD-dependent epimerase/dehydratase family protein [Planctomycetaceae bacterium]|nr:NAD-dependent epimerase/dehydratase family protein [Planctomycetaceae bacterium]